MGTYTCEKCGKPFEIRATRRTVFLCPECKPEYLREQKKLASRSAYQKIKTGKSKPAPLDLSRIEKMRGDYIRKTGNFVTYGRFVAMLEGSIDEQFR